MSNIYDMSGKKKVIFTDDPETNIKYKEIIELWRQGYSIEQIVNRFPSMICRMDNKRREALYHKVEVIIFNYQKESMRE